MKKIPVKSESVERRMKFEKVHPVRKRGREEVDLEKYMHDHRHDLDKPKKKSLLDKKK